MKNFFEQLKTSFQEAGNAGEKAQLQDYWELAKPRLVFLVLISAAVGYAMSPLSEGKYFLFLVMMLGTALVAASSMVLNQWVERDVDALMQRTQRRPIPAGKVNPFEALVFGLVLGVLGLAILEMAVNSRASFFAAATLLSYLFVYTPLKLKSDWSTLVGAFPGALPPLIGWVATGAPLNAEAGTLFGIMFLWQMPHFYAIAWIYRKDYEQAGVQVLSVTQSSEKSILYHSLFYSILLLPVSLAPTWLGMAGMLYFFNALLLGLVMIAAVFVGFKNMDQGARVLFRASVVYLSLLMLIMVVDKQ